MSDLLLNNLAQHYAKEDTKLFIAEYNSEANEGLTQEGKRELLEFYFSRAFLCGFNLAKDSKAYEKKHKRPDPLPPSSNGQYTITP